MATDEQPAMITDYEQMHGLPQWSVVQDAEGRVWCVKHVDRNGETWLCPFSDEYSFTMPQNGETYALGDTPALPIRLLNVVSTGGG